MENVLKVFLIVGSVFLFGYAFFFWIGEDISRKDLCVSVCETRGLQCYDTTPTLNGIAVWCVVDGSPKIIEIRED